MSRRSTHSFKLITVCTSEFSSQLKVNLGLESLQILLLKELPAREVFIKLNVIILCFCVVRPQIANQNALPRGFWRVRPLFRLLFHLLLGPVVSETASELLTHQVWLTVVVEIHRFPESASRESIGVLKLLLLFTV